MNYSVSGSGNRIVHGSYTENHEGVIIDQGIRACPRCCNNIMNFNDKACNQCLGKERFASLLAMILIPLMIFSLAYMWNSDFILSLGFEGDTAKTLTWILLALETLVVAVCGYKLATRADE